MSKAAKFEFNLAGLNELMKSPEMAAILTDAGNSIASAAGAGYGVEVAHPIRFIAIASVRTETWEAATDNRNNNTLLKAAESVSI